MTRGRRFHPPDDRFGAMAGHAIVPRERQIALARTMMEAEALRLEGWPCDPTPARHALAAANVRLVIREAANAARNPNRTPAADLDALISDGCLGMMRAIDGFEPSKGFAFTTFATFGARLRMASDAKNARLKPWPSQSLDHALNPGQTLGDVLVAPADSDEPTAARAAEDEKRDAELALVRTLLSDLDPRSRRIIEARYGLGGCDRLTQSALSAEFGVTKARIQQIEARALHRLQVLADRMRAPAEVA
jgi:RNA polymerase sigma factor (sigma-70 family)